MSTKKERMYQRIAAHGENLLAIFPNSTEKDPVKLCKKLLQFERKLNHLMCEECNGTATALDKETVEVLRNKVAKLLGKDECYQYGFFVNGDPRGYTLKLSDEMVRAWRVKIYTDWGGYGILAPDLSVE